jgi:hypothetical protein
MKFVKLMMERKISLIYFENQLKVCGRNVEFIYFKPDNVYNYIAHYSVKETFRALGTKYLYL